MLQKIIPFLCLFCLVFQANAQETPTEPKKKNFKAFLVNVTYGFHLPAGDLADRFGSNSTVGTQVDFIYNGYFGGLEGDFLFGGGVMTDVLAPLRTPEGAIIGDNFDFAFPRLAQRGFYAGGYIGRVFPLLKKHARSGLRLSLGLGFLQHKIQIVDEGGSIVQLQGDYKKGYDRLTNGLALRQFIGYHHFSQSRLINFFVGFEFSQGFTKSRRDFNFDTMSADTESRFDGLYGIKLGWTLPIFVGDSDEYTY